MNGAAWKLICHASASTIGSEESGPRLQGRWRRTFIAAGLKYVLLVAVLFVPGTILYVWARREQKLQLFTPAEWAQRGGEIPKSPPCMGGSKRG